MLDGDGYRKEAKSESWFVADLNDQVGEARIVVWDEPDEDTPPRADGLRSQGGGPK